MATSVTAKPIFPVLAPLYDILSPLADPILRISAGGVLLVHGIQKLMNGPAPVIASMERIGAHPATPFAYWIMFLETVGALAVIFGLFTRFFAACLMVEMLVIAFVAQFGHGFSAPKGGYEMTLMWSGVFLSILLRGGGRYSLDRLLGFEL